MKKRGSQSSLTEFFSGFKKSRLSAKELSLERYNSASSEVSNDSNEVGNSQLESAENTTDSKCASNTVPEAEAVDDIIVYCDLQLYRLHYWSREWISISAKRAWYSLCV